jgi:glycosyltransferase involved in cell wall biosynthesis
MKKLNFLHICLTESWGGLEMAVSKWNEILKEHKHNNLNICTPGSPLSQDLQQKALPLLEWDSAHYFAPDFTWKLRKLVKQKKIDVVMLQNLRDLWIVSPALYALPDVKLVGFAQMLLSVKKTDFLHQWVYSRLDLLLTLTDWQQDALSPFLPVPALKYKTIPNFVDSQSFDPKHRSETGRRQLGFENTDFVIGVIGRIDEQKGQKELLEAFSLIAQKNKGTQLLIVGEPTRSEIQQATYFQNLKQQVSDLKLEKRVRFMGFQKETNKLFANLDLFVLPSYQETFGFVVVEAMASGTPVLATRAGGPPEILQDGQCGFLCEPKSANSIAEQLQVILDQPQERRERARRALKRARKFYDREAVYQRFIKLVRL